MDKQLPDPTKRAHAGEIGVGVIDRNEVDIEI